MDYQVKCLENLSFGLSQYVEGPSRVKGHTLDLLWANKHEFDFPFIQPQTCYIGVHFPIMFNFFYQCKIKNKQSML